MDIHEHLNNMSKDSDIRELYYCRDYSYGICKATSNHFVQWENEEFGKTGTLYRIVGFCDIVVENFPHRDQTLDTIVESMDTGNLYCVQRRFYVEHDSNAPVDTNSIRNLLPRFDNF